MSFNISILGTKATTVAALITRAVQNPNMGEHEKAACTAIEAVIATAPEDAVVHAEASGHHWDGNQGSASGTFKIDVRYEAPPKPPAPEPTPGVQG